MFSQLKSCSSARRAHRLAGAFVWIALWTVAPLRGQTDTATSPSIGKANPSDPVSGKGGGGTGNGDADAAWNKLKDKVTSIPVQTVGKVIAVDWASIAADAQKFQHDFPDSTQARGAAKIAANALIHKDDDLPDLSQTARAAGDIFVGDAKNDPRDRLEIKITLEQSKLRRAVFASSQQRLIAHSAHARDLIRLFPDQPEGYGYLLSLAKGESMEKTHRLADELLSSNAPDVLKQGARRVVARLQLAGQPFKLSGAESAIKAAKGMALVIYTWQGGDEEFLKLILRLGKTGDTRFIGINLDQNTGLARAKVTLLKLPGTQFYDGSGLDGPMAQQLQLITYSSIYLVDGKGIVQDVNGQVDPIYKLVDLVRNQEGRP